MDLYLDTEFDGHGGDLISLALAGDDGSHWYGLWPTMILDPWASEHVHPQLFKLPPTVPPHLSDTETVRASLRRYLIARQTSDVTIWADWPDDFAHLMRLMSGPSYAESFMIPCTMQLIVTPPGEPKPEIPHNALSDAIALMQWHQSSVANVA